MPGAHDIAAQLIAEQHAAGRAIDKMQLQKLLYLVQGANLEFWGTAAFREPFRAYTRGPVVANVEQTYRDVVPGASSIPEAVGGRTAQLDTDVAETVDTVLRHFGEWTAVELETYVKQPGSPWHEVRGDLADGDPSQAEIPVDLIADWFHEHGVVPTAGEPTDWDATPSERAAADDRLREAKVSGAFSPELTAEVVQAARRSLAHLQHHRASR